MISTYHNPSMALPSDPWAQQCVAAQLSGANSVVDYERTTTYRVGGFVSGMVDGGIAVQVITDGFGRVVDTIDGKLQHHARGHDSRGQVIWEATSYPAPSSYAPYNKPTLGDIYLASMVEYHYDLLGRVRETDRYRIETGEIVKSTADYDDLHRRVVATQAGHTTVTVFDGLGRPIDQLLPDGVTHISTAYSDHTKVTTTTTNSGVVSKTYFYDGLDLLKQVLDGAGTVLFNQTHDLYGHTISEQHGNGAPISRTFDLFRRLSTESQLLSSGTATSTYQWDGNDHLSQITDPSGNATKYTIDGLGRTRTVVDSVSRTQQLTYCTLGMKPTSIVDFDQTARQFLYDETGQLKIETTQPGPGLESYPTTRAFSYTPLGQMQQAELYRSGTLVNTVAFAFDSLGNKLGESSSALPLGVRHTFDINGRWATTSIGTATMQHSFDALGRLASVSLNQASLAIYDYGQAGIGGPLGIHYANGAQAGLRYDANRGVQTDLSLGMASPGESTSTPLASLSERFGLDGSPRQRQRSFMGGAPLTDLFQVDGAGRLMSENANVSGVALQSGDLTNDSVKGSINQLGTPWRNYTLDHLANWTSRTDGAGPGFSSTPDALNRLTSVNGVSPGYDPALNTVNIADPDGAESYTFDSFKHVRTAMKGTTSVQYDYDALGRRYKETDATGDHFLVWDGDQVVAHGDSATDGTWYTVEVPGQGLDSHVAQVEGLGAGARRFYHQGPDGSMLAVTDDNGLVEGYSYSAYGEVSITGFDGSARTTSSFNNRFLFQGQLYDPWTSTYSMRAREYRPKWGRFLSVDPTGVAGGLNAYAFVSGRPLTFRDPSGLHEKGLKPQTGQGSSTAQGTIDGKPVEFSVSHWEGGPSGHWEPGRSSWMLTLGPNDYLVIEYAPTWVDDTPWTARAWHGAGNFLHGAGQAWASDTFTWGLRRPDRPQSRPEHYGQILGHYAGVATGGVEMFGGAITGLTGGALTIGTAGVAVAPGAALSIAGIAITSSGAVTVGAAFDSLNSLRDSEGSTESGEPSGNANPVDKRFTPDQSAVVDLAKQAQRTGLSPADAQELLDMAEEAGLSGRNDIGTDHWVGGDHIHIGPVDHIPVR